MPVNISVFYNVTSNINVTYFTITFENPVLFSEVANQAGWGTIYYATKTVSNHNPQIPLLIVTHVNCLAREYIIYRFNILELLFL
jgi:hypothetical protein